MGESNTIIEIYAWLMVITLHEPKSGELNFSNISGHNDNTVQLQRIKKKKEPKRSETEIIIDSLGKLNNLLQNNYVFSVVLCTLPL